MILAILLSFGSIYRTSGEHIQEVRWSEDDETDRSVRLFHRGEIYYNNLHLHFVESESDENIFIRIYGRLDAADQEDNRLHNISVGQGEQRNQEIDSEARWVIPGRYDNGEFVGLDEGDVVDMEYTVRYYHYPYYPLALVALIAVAGLIYLLTRAYQDAYDKMVEDFEKVKMEEDYIPPQDKKV